MNEYYENIKNKTVCAECGSKEMAIGYLYEPSGIVKKLTTVLGLSAYIGSSNILMIICTKCGFVNKSLSLHANNSKNHLQNDGLII